MTDMEIKVILEEADVRKDFFTSNCKENNLKCPLCGEKIEHIKDGWCNCKNRCTGSGSISLWQELIRTRKALDVAKKALQELKDVIACPPDVSYETGVSMYADGELQEIATVEQKGCTNG